MNKLRKDKTGNSVADTIDSEQDIHLAKALAVPLAFSIAAGDKKISKHEVRVIESWAGNNIAGSKVSNKIRCKIHRILARIITFFPNRNRNRIYIICNEITTLAPLGIRCNILDMCLHVVRANGIATTWQLTMLKNTATLLEIRWERFRDMMEKTVPASMHETEDAEISLGVTEDMNEDQARRHLSKEYRKWNARITNSDHEIQAQAEYMLELIAAARSQCAG